MKRHVRRFLGIASARISCAAHAACTLAGRAFFAIAALMAFCDRKCGPQSSAKKNAYVNAPISLGLFRSIFLNSYCVSCFHFFHREVRIRIMFRTFIIGAVTMCAALATTSRTAPAAIITSFHLPSGPIIPVSTPAPNNDNTVVTSANTLDLPVAPGTAPYSAIQTRSALISQRKHLSVPRNTLYGRRYLTTLQPLGRDSICSFRRAT